MRKRKFEVESQSESEFSPRQSENDKNAQSFLRQILKSQNGEKMQQDKPPTISFDLLASSLYSIIWAVILIYLSYNSVPTCKVVSKTDLILAYFHCTFVFIILIYMAVVWWAISQKKNQAWIPLQRFISTYRLLQIIAELVLLTVLIMNIVHYKNECDDEFITVNSIYVLLQSLLIGSTIIMLILYSFGIATETISKSLRKTYGSFS